MTFIGSQKQKLEKIVLIKQQKNMSGNKRCVNYKCGLS
jgi:hypothetical protein